MKRSGSFTNHKKGFMKVHGCHQMKRSGSFTNQKNWRNPKELYQQVGLAESDKQNAMGYSSLCPGRALIDSKNDKQNAIAYSPTHQEVSLTESKSLTDQLKEFGLNPKYWILKKLSQPGVEKATPFLLRTAGGIERRIKQKKARWMLIHKWEKDFCLLGATEENIGWTDLEWVI